MLLNSARLFTAQSFQSHASCCWIWMNEQMDLPSGGNVLHVLLCHRTTDAWPFSFWRALLVKQHHSKRPGFPGTNTGGSCNDWAGSVGDGELAALMFPNTGRKRGKERVSPAATSVSWTQGWSLTVYQSPLRDAFTISCRLLENCVVTEKLCIFNKESRDVLWIWNTLLCIYLWTKPWISLW